MSLLGELAVSVVGDTKQLEKTFQQVEDRTTALQSKMQKMGQNVGNTGKKMSKFVSGPIAAVGAGIVGLASKTADYGDRVAKTAEQMGVSVEGMQEMEYWASQNGLSAEELEKAVGRLNQRIGRAADGNEKYSEAFKNLGVAIKDSQGNMRDTESVMQDTISALRNIEDPALRSARASEVFGTRMARRLMPALNDGSLSLEEAAQKAQELGIVMDEEAAKKSEEFGDAVDNLKQSFTGVFREIGAKIIPVLVDDLIPALQENVIPLVSDFGEWIGKLIEWFANLDPKFQKIILAITGLAAAIGPVLIVLGTLISSAAALAPVLAALTGPIGLVAAAIAYLVVVGINLYKNWDEIKEKLTKVWNNIKSKAEEVWNSIKDFFKKTWEGIKDTAEDIWDAIMKFFKKWGKDIILLITGPAGWLVLLGKKIAENWDSIKQKALNIWNNIKSGINNIWSKITSSASSAASNLYRTVKRKLENLWSYIKSIPRKALRWGKDIIKGLIDGIKSLSIPMPHFDFSVSQKSIAGVTFPVPSVDVDWYARGTDFHRGGLAVVGERGPELVNLPRGSQVTPNNELPSGVNFERMFEGANIYIRDDSDIKKLAREIGRYADKNKRGRGVT